MSDRHRSDDDAPDLPPLPDDVTIPDAIRAFGHGDALRLFALVFLDGVRAGYGNAVMQWAGLDQEAARDAMHAAVADLLDNHFDGLVTMVKYAVNQAIEDMDEFDGNGCGCDCPDCGRGDS